MDYSYISLGNLNKPIHKQIGKAFNKLDVRKVFNFKGAAYKEGHYKMKGHATPPGVQHQFIFITLIKSSMAHEHRYNDYFISDKKIHWQSKNQVSQKEEDGISIIKHKEIDKPIHLFVRKISRVNNITLPFTYCGKIDFIKVIGNNPINVEFELHTKLSDKLKTEFLRI